MSRDNRSSLSLPATSSRLGNVLYSTHIPPSFSLSPSTTILAAQYISKVRELQCASSHEIYGLRRLGASFFFVSFQVKWNELTVYFIITKHSKKQKMKWGRLESGRETAMRLRDKRQHDVPSRSFSFLNILFVKSVIWFGLVFLVTSGESFTNLPRNRVPSIDKQVHWCVEGGKKFKQINRKLRREIGIRNRWWLTSVSLLFFVHDWESSVDVHQEEVVNVSFYGLWSSS